MLEKTALINIILGVKTSESPQVGQASNNGENSNKKNCSNLLILSNGLSPQNHENLFYDLHVPLRDEVF